jgi:hypothetical protein
VITKILYFPTPTVFFFFLFFMKIFMKIPSKLGLHCEDVLEPLPGGCLK